MMYQFRISQIVTHQEEKNAVRDMNTRILGQNVHQKFLFTRRNGVSLDLYGQNEKKKIGTLSGYPKLNIFARNQNHLNLCEMTEFQYCSK